jgi:hypothetical protein
MNRYDWLGMIAIAMMLFSAVIICYYLISNTISTCVSDPLKYTVNQLAKDNYTYVVLKIYKNKNDMLPVVTKEIDLSSPNIYSNQNLFISNQSK